MPPSRPPPRTPRAATLSPAPALVGVLPSAALAFALASTPGCAASAGAPSAAGRPPRGGAEGGPVDARASDERELLRLHAEVLENHRTANVERWLSNEAEGGYVVANRGIITRPTKGERRSRIGPYLASTTFREYRDLVAPVVKVSRDGSLGWVVVQVHAEGVRRAERGDEPLEFTCAWIELYEKRDGRWLGVGNVSNFKE